MAIDQVGNSLAGLGSSTSSSGALPNQMGQSDFLKLMVAQLENQDPTKPLDNNEFLSQMAQFSMVNGIENLNGSFGAVAETMLGAQGLQAANLLNKEAVTSSNLGHFDGIEPVSGLIDLAVPSSALEIQIRDLNGALVHAFGIDGSRAGEVAFNWDGLDSQGRQVPKGNYVFVAAGVENGAVRSLPVSMGNAIESVSIDRNSMQVRLNLSNGQVAYLSDVREYR